jgi:hypothetical protein
MKVQPVFPQRLFQAPIMRRKTGQWKAAAEHDAIKWNRIML